MQGARDTFMARRVHFPCLLATSPLPSEHSPGARSLDADCHHQPGVALAFLLAFLVLVAEISRHVSKTSCCIHTPPFLFLNRSSKCSADLMIFSAQHPSGLQTQMLTSTAITYRFCDQGQFTTQTTPRDRFCVCCCRSLRVYMDC